MPLQRNRFCAALAHSLPQRWISASIQLNGIRPVGVANLATRCGAAALASPGGKLLSEAKLMRGGDRLVLECTRMNVIRFDFHHSTYCCRDFKLSPPLISHDKISVPRCRYFIVTAFPRGKPRTQKPLATTIQRSALLREFRVAKLATPTNSEIFGDFHSSNRSVAWGSGG